MTLAARPELVVNGGMSQELLHVRRPRRCSVPSIMQLMEPFISIIDGMKEGTCVDRQRHKWHFCRLIQ